MAHTSTDNNEKSHADMQTLRDDMARIRTTLADMLSSLDGGRGRVVELGGKLRDGGKRAVEKSEETIRERPFLSVLVVFLVGMLLGKVIDRRLLS